MKSNLLFMSLFVLLSTVFLARPVFAAGVLDGKIFSGQIGDKVKVDAQSQVDDFVFAAGKFKSALCNTFGYGDGVYTANTENDVVKFEADTSNETGGKMKWVGTVTGEEIQGTTTTIENGQISESWFKGKLKQA